MSANKEISTLRRPNAELQHMLRIAVELSPTVDKLSNRWLLKPENAWQTSDILPKPDTPNFKLFKEESKELPPNIALTFAGNTVTELGLPDYTSIIKSFAISPHPEDDPDSPWDTWRRGWSAEETRHLLLSYGIMANSGIYNMHNVDVDSHKFIADGFFPNLGGDIYRALMYTAWQEEATKGAHSGVSRLSGELGLETYRKAAGAMAGDEARHAEFYKGVVKGIIGLDPEGAIKSFHGLVKTGLIMPGATMNNFNIFTSASTVSGVYGPIEYVDILGKLIKQWNIEELKLTGESDKYRVEIIEQYRVLKKIAERATRQAGKMDLSPIKDRWLVAA